MNGLRVFALREPMLGLGSGPPLLHGLGRMRLGASAGRRDLANAIVLLLARKGASQMRGCHRLTGTLVDHLDGCESVVVVIIARVAFGRDATECSSKESARCT